MIAHLTPDQRSTLKIAAAMYAQTQLVTAAAAVVAITREPGLLATIANSIEAIGGGASQAAVDVRALQPVLESLKPKPVVAPEPEQPTE